MLEIVTEKFVNTDGEKCYRIKEVKGFISELPKGYKSKLPYFYIHWNSKKQIHYCHEDGTGHMSHNIEPEEIYNQEVWENNILPNLQKAGERLTKIRQKIKNTQKRWKGEATFCI